MTDYDPMRDDPENAWPIICEQRQRIAELEAKLKERTTETQHLRKALTDATRKLSAYSRGCPADKETRNTLLPRFKELLDQTIMLDAARAEENSDD